MGHVYVASIPPPAGSRFAVCLLTLAGWNGSLACHRSIAQIGGMLISQLCGLFGYVFVAGECYQEFADGS